MSDATRTKEFGLQTRTHAADGLGIGGAVGGAVGAAVAAIAAVGTTYSYPASIWLLLVQLRQHWRVPEQVVQLEALLER